MDFIYFLIFWGVLLTTCGLIALFLPDNHVSHEDL